MIPMTCIDIRGIIATNAITPNASLPPEALPAPIVNDSTNVEVIGPDATPPESNAMPVKFFGHHIISRSDNA